MQRSLRTPVSVVLVVFLLAACTGPPPSMEKIGRRPVALDYGMFVTPDPAQNPIDPPERFTGFHTGIDFETFENEADAVVSVQAICSGSVLYSGFVVGYGGALVQQCKFDDERVTVLYGHLDQVDLPPEATILMPGDRVGQLAPARSTWTDGNRKHLHLSIHRGDAIDYRGYVQTESELLDFIDPRSVLPPGTVGRRVEKFHVWEVKS